MAEQPESVNLCKTTRIAIVALPIVISTVFAFMVADRWNLYGKIDMLTASVATVQEELAVHRENAVGAKETIARIIRDQELLRVDKCNQRQCDRLERHLDTLEKETKR